MQFERTVLACFLKASCSSFDWYFDMDLTTTAPTNFKTRVSFCCSGAVSVCFEEDRAEGFLGVPFVETFLSFELELESDVEGAGFAAAVAAAIIAAISCLVGLVDRVSTVGATASRAVDTTCSVRPNGLIASVGVSMSCSPKRKRFVGRDSSDSFSAKFKSIPLLES